VIDPNEKYLRDKIQSILKQANQPITIEFKTTIGKNLTIPDVYRITSTGHEAYTQPTRKADIVLNSYKKGVIPISIKKDSAEFWQSGDRWSFVMRPIMDKLEKEGKVSFIKNPDGTYNISQQIAKKANADVSRQVIFGTDILPHGAVITRSFAEPDFIYNDKTNKLTIQCSSIIRNLYDVPPKQRPWLLLYHQKDKNVLALGKKGLRVRVVYEERVNNTVLKVA
jgi:hypothetical protein